MVDLSTAAATQRELLDQHTRDIVQWHFGPDTGSNFWLEKTKTLDFDPLKDINGLAMGTSALSGQATVCVRNGRDHRLPKVSGRHGRPLD